MRLRRLAEFARERKVLKDERGGKGHSFWCSVLSAHSHRPEAVNFRIFISSLILLNIFAFVMESDVGIKNRYFVYFRALEGFSSCVFLVEYCVRVYTIPERRRYAGLEPRAARMQWICSWESVVDIVAMAPWYVEVVADISCRALALGCGVDLPNLQFLRVLRLFRLLKSAPIIHSFDVVARVLYFNAEILCVALIICLVLLLLTSTLLYYMQPREATGPDEEDYSSIMATMYLSVMMLTGQGQPGGSMPWYTKLIVTVTAMFSVAQFAIPASMLTWGFEQEAERRIKKQHDNRKKQVERIKRGLTADAISSSSSGESTATEWDEYEDIVVGSSSDSSASDAEKAARRTKVLGKGGMEIHLSSKEQARVARIFSALDRDESGLIKTHELAIITDPKGAESLSKKLDPDGDGQTTSEEFFAWMVDVKKSSSDGIFEMLLGDLERIPRTVNLTVSAVEKGDLGRGAEHGDLGVGSLRRLPEADLSDAGACSAPIAAVRGRSLSVDLGGGASNSMTDALVTFAEQFKRLQDENDRLMEQIRQRDKAISELRSKMGLRPEQTVAPP